MDNAKKILELLVDGNRIAYSPISGYALIITDYDKQKSEAVDVKTFIQLRAAGYIKHEGSMRQGHPIFHGGVDFYGITEAGRKENRVKNDKDNQLEAETSTEVSGEATGKESSC